MHLESAEIRGVRRLLKAVRSAMRRQEAALAQMAAVAASLESILDLLLDGGSAERDRLRAFGARARESARGSEETERDKRRKADARLGIGEISTVRLSSGWAAVVVAEFAEFMLPPKLADLLEVLIAVDERHEDGFPAFRSYDALRRTLLGGSPGPDSNHSIAQRVHRLRKEFENAGLNRYLIDTDRVSGVRLLVRRYPQSESRPRADSTRAYTIHPIDA